MCQSLSAIANNLYVCSILSINDRPRWETVAPIDLYLLYFISLISVFFYTHTDNCRKFDQKSDSEIDDTISHWKCFNHTTMQSFMWNKNKYAINIVFPWLIIVYWGWMTCELSSLSYRIDSGVATAKLLQVPGCKPKLDIIS